jgi:hypothetical protein
MEPTQPSSNESLFELAIDEQSISYLSDIAKWAKFLSIVGFILCGMFVMGSLLAASFASDFYSYPSNSRLIRQTFSIGSIFVTMIYILIALLCFFPYLYLYNFSTKMQMALRNNDQGNLHASFNNLRSCFKFVGILTIIMLSFCVIMAILVMSASALFR